MRYRCFIVLALLIAAGFSHADTDILQKSPSHFAKLAADNGTPDLKIHYKLLPAPQNRNKPTLVFIHGWCCDLTVWNAQASAFNGQLNLLFIDLPGYGQSDHPRIDYTMDLFAKAINAVLEDAKINEALPVGHSMGVPVVRQFYRLYPAKTKALILIDGGLRPFTKDPAEAEKWVSRFKEETFKDSAPKMLTGMIPADNAELRQHIENLVYATTPQVAISSQRAMIDESIWKEDKIQVPTQALMAQNRFWTEDYKDFVKQLVPNLDYREFQNVGHFLFMEKPHEINAAITEFLKKQKLL
ncbi:MAG TPA: alpha/beta hydrolase [Tepidisphaeraceae bacterium]|nr:alpha/beta hydrolase [Tepidisphaeraceae bacterium]